MASQPLDTFVDSLLEKAQLTDVSDDKKQEYRQTIMQLLQQKMGIEMMKKLPDTAADEFIKLVEKSAKPDELLAFFQKNIPDFEKELQDVLARFAQDFEYTQKQFQDIANQQ